MPFYLVKPGDTLSKIATSTLGSAGKWRIIAEMNSITNPSKIRIGQRLQLPGEVLEVPGVINTAEGVRRVGRERVRISIEQEAVYATPLVKSEKIFVGRLHRRGLHRMGVQEPETFIAENREMIRKANLTESEVNVILAISENTYNLDAVDTWDKQFISFGMFQWTAGPSGKPGDLPALLQLIKNDYPDIFQHYWAQFGLDVTAVGHKFGWFTYRGKKLVSAVDKAILREHIWAYRFVRAGADIEVQAAQIQYAANRIHQFYLVKSSKLDGYALADLITSEYGVALLLDHHIVRPGYVRSCVAEALQLSNLTAADMSEGDDEAEQLLLKNYLEIRETHGTRPMPDARQRAAVIRGYLADGIISAARKSFISSMKGRHRRG